MIEFTNSEIEDYSKSTVSGTGFLAYRDVELLLTKHKLKPKRTLDLGCGSGRSIGVLKDMCESITGCDINQLALENTQKAFPDVPVFLNDLSSEQYPEENFDAIFSFLMFFHFDSLDAMRKELTRCFNSLDKDGFLFIVHGNHSIATASYTSVKGMGHIPTKEGERFKVLLKNIDLVVEDSYWSIETLIKESEDIGFHTMERHAPLGHTDDKQTYIDEYTVAPYSYLILRK
ncbi:class I SAM-dependent methyltransferase [Vibrio profundum]|uniref:class I SAM-dependent methyltransferase n=1 Tax=Vibrio profundum TaxID=2910247 RepID=UPI003D0BF961